VRAGLFALLAGALLTLGAAPAPPAVDDARLMGGAPAATLADYRLFLGKGVGRPNGGLTPYDVATPLFSDYADKHRLIYLPPGAKARFAGPGLIDLPVGTVLVKTFAYPADFRRPTQNVRLVETRLLIHRADGWAPLTYVWNAAQDQAVLKRTGQRMPIGFIDAAGRARQVSYEVPNVNQCKQCHGQNGATTPLGPKARNLNWTYAYPGGAENQLAHWTRLGLLEGAPAPGEIPATPLWADAKTPVGARARAYLDANCAHCHSRAGYASNSGLYLSLEETNASALGVGKRPVAAGRGSGGLEFGIDPGHPERSILLYRMISNEPGVMMPQIGRSVAHDEGVEAVRAYIAAMRTP
jgi:uncharacterized repeat protein (TIGR03806 family)